MNHPTGMSSVDGHGGGGLGIGIGNGNPSQQQQLQQQQYHHQGQPQGQQQYVPQPPQQYLQQPQQPQQYVPTQPQPQPTTSMSPQRQPQRNGPRANCDQVVFEAIAKAAEIVVASRCWIESDPALAAAQTGSGRFNLLVPEVKSVRNILQRWKRTMHVPLRLDVYYQHAPKSPNETGERELLERWCLEYAPTATHTGGGMYNHPEDPYNSLGGGHIDPIVQLRKVCKNIVVWLRTLYCHSRLLPAQALRKNPTGSNTATNTNTNIGFSIYVVGEGQDDVSGLVQQGFDSEPKPSAGTSTGVPTPYGVLGWRVYLAPRELVRRLVRLEQEQARLLQQQYANTSPSTTRSIPMKVVHQQQPQQQQHGHGATALPVARSAPTHSRVYRRANSTPLERHPQQPQPTRQYSKSPGRTSGMPSPSTLLAPRSYHPQSGSPFTRKSFTEDISLFNRGGGSNINSTTNTSKGLYPNDKSPIPSVINNNNTASNTAAAAAANTDDNDSPSSGGSRNGAGGGGIKQSKNLSALSLALLSMNDDANTTSSSSHPSGTDADEVKPISDEAKLLGPSEIRRAALHNAPPSAATGVGEYGYAYNNHHTASAATTHPSQHHPLPHPNNNNLPPNLSTSPAFRGPSTPVSSTFGTTPPGYLLSATPSVGSHGTTTLGTTPGGGGLLLPPSRGSTPGAPVTASNGIAPPFVRPLGFAGQAQGAATPTATATASSTPQSQSQPHVSHEVASSGPALPGGVPKTPEDDHKPSLDLLHSSPFHHSVLASHGASAAHQSSAAQKDGLSSFLQAEETASMEAATTFINDFYHHHYPMASMMSGAAADDPHHHHHHHMGSASEDYHLHHHHHHHHSSLFAEGSSSAAFLEADGLLHQAEDMPFAVDGLSSGLTTTAAAPGSQSLVNNHTTTTKHHEASLMVASMGMVPQKRLALFENSSSTAANEGAKCVSTHADVDALTDQLADFRSFGATLSSHLTTSVGSGG